MKNAAVKREIANLRRRCHSMITEMEAAADTLEGDALVEALNTIALEYNEVA